MKLNYISIIFFLSTLFVSCEKEGVVSIPSFDVTGYDVTSTIDTAGNPVQQVTFNLSGDASIISYYSGIIGSEYSYREGRILEVSGLRSSFTSVAPTGAQQNSLSIMASTDFNGIYDKENVQAATWIDITNRYALNSLGASSALHS